MILPANAGLPRRSLRSWNRQPQQPDNRFFYGITTRSLQVTIQPAGNKSRHFRQLARYSAQQHPAQKSCPVRTLQQVVFRSLQILYGTPWRFPLLWPSHSSCVFRHLCRSESPGSGPGHEMQSRLMQSNSQTDCFPHCFGGRCCSSASHGSSTESSVSADQQSRPASSCWQ